MLGDKRLTNHVCFISHPGGKPCLPLAIRPTIHWLVVDPSPSTTSAPNEALTRTTGVAESAFDISTSRRVPRTAVRFRIVYGTAGYSAVACALGMRGLERRMMVRLPGVLLLQVLLQLLNLVAVYRGGEREVLSVTLGARLGIVVVAREPSPKIQGRGGGGGKRGYRQTLGTSTPTKQVANQKAQQGTSNQSIRKCLAPGTRRDEPSQPILYPTSPPPVSSYRRNRTKLRPHNCTPARNTAHLRPACSVSEHSAAPSSPSRS